MYQRNPTRDCQLENRIYLSIYLSIHRSIHLSINLFSLPPIQASFYLSRNPEYVSEKSHTALPSGSRIYPAVRIQDILFIYPPTHLSSCLSTYIHRSIYQSFQSPTQASFYLSQKIPHGTAIWISDLSSRKDPGYFACCG